MFEKIWYIIVNLVFNGERREYNGKMKMLRASVLLVDKDYKMFKIQENLNDKVVCHYYLGLFLGILFTIISLAWWIHMYIYYCNDKVCFTQ